jgi:hypothetical protein
MSEAEGVGVAVRAELHALDAALAEHRRALALAASRREAERMARAREVKAAAQASAAALEQPVERPMRSLQLAETWVQVDRIRHRLTPEVRAELAGGELRVHGADWTGRIVVAPGERPAAAAREAAALIAAAVSALPQRARARLAHVVATGIAHARACYEAAGALATADREASERHDDRARIDACVAELTERLGPRFAREAAETAAARARLDQARVHLATPPAQPYAWIEGWPPVVAGALLRDIPDEGVAAARPAVRRLARVLGDDEPLLALATTPGGAVAAVTPVRLLVGGPDGVEARPPSAAPPDGLLERRPGRLAAALELVLAAGAASGEPDRLAGDAADLLGSLGRLRDAGILSAAEYEAKRALVLRVSSPG